MDTYQEVVARLEKTNDPIMKKKILQGVSDEIKQRDEIKRMIAWWDARYYYTDKNKTRAGDRFVWLYLMATTTGADKRSLEKFKKVYSDTILSQETKQAKELDAKGYQNQLVDAAKIYIDSLGDPKPLLGIISQKDKSEHAKHMRIGTIILQDHMDPFWRYLGDMEDIKIVAASFCYAAEILNPGITYTLKDIIDSSELEGDFDNWISDVFSRAKRQEEQDKEE